MVWECRILLNFLQYRNRTAESYRHGGPPVRSVQPFSLKFQPGCVPKWLEGASKRMFIAFFDKKLASTYHIEFLFIKTTQHKYKIFAYFFIYIK